MNLILERSRIMAIDYVMEQDSGIPGPKEVLFAPPLWLFALIVGAFLAVVAPDSIADISLSLHEWNWGVFVGGVVLVTLGTGLYFWTIYSRIMFIVTGIVLLFELIFGTMTFGMLWAALSPLIAFQIAIFVYGLWRKPWQTIMPTNMNFVCKIAIQAGFFFMFTHILVNVLWLI
jgi:hypothetical protein